MMKNKLILIAVFICLVLNLFALSPENGYKKLLEWEFNPVRTLYLYKDVAAKEARFLPIVNMKDVPADSRWYVENNSYGIMAYIAGVKNNDQKQKAYGIEILDFAMRQQMENGEFPEKNDVHHSLAFYYEIVSRFLILAENKGFADNVPVEVIQRLRSGLRKGAIWFGNESSWKDEFWKDHFHHRFLLNASVILLAQRALGDLPPETLAQAYRWLGIACERQLPDGIITEQGGHDTGYQSLGITFSTGILLVCELPMEERKSLENLVRKGTDWLLTRISISGEIDGTGNTRMGGNSKELSRTDGKIKAIKPYEHAFAIYGAAAYFDNDRYQQAADKIMKFYNY